MTVVASRPAAHRTELWLIRHGESTGNRDGILQGREDLPLSELGHEQARRLAERLARIHARNPFAALYCSDLVRAVQTASAIAQAIGLPAIPDDRLREIDVGSWAGLTTEQITNTFPQEWAAWQDRDPDLRRGGGESYRDAHDRFTPAMAALAQEHPGERLLVVAHGGVIRAYAGSLMGLDLRRIWHLSVGNTAITRIRPFDPTAGAGDPRPGKVLCLNDCAHVEA